MRLQLAAGACLLATLTGCAGPRAMPPRPAAALVEPAPLTRLAVAGPTPAPARDDSRPARPQPPRPAPHRSLTPRHPRRGPTVCDLAHGLWPPGSLPDALCRGAYG